MNGTFNIQHLTFNIPISPGRGIAKDFLPTTPLTGRMAEHPDRFLVARMIRGDEAAFSEFFDANFGALFRFAMPRVGADARTAEEVVQSTLCRAVRKLTTYRGEAALLTWLCTIC